MSLTDPCFTMLTDSVVLDIGNHGNLKLSNGCHDNLTLRRKDKKGKMTEIISLFTEFLFEQLN